MAILNGTDLIVKVADQPLGHSTTCSLDLSLDLPDSTSKDSAGWAEHIQGVRSGTIDFEGFVDYTDEDNSKRGIVYLNDLIINRTSVTVYFGTETTGDVIYTATASLNSANTSADSENPTTYSGQFTINGAITKATLT